MRGFAKGRGDLVEDTDWAVALLTYFWKLLYDHFGDVLTVLLGTCTMACWKLLRSLGLRRCSSRASNEVRRLIFNNGAIRDGVWSTYLNTDVGSSDTTTSEALYLTDLLELEYCHDRDICLVPV